MKIQPFDVVRIQTEQFCPNTEQNNATHVIVKVNGAYFPILICSQCDYNADRMSRNLSVATV